MKEVLFIRLIATSIYIVILYFVLGSLNSIIICRDQLIEKIKREVGKITSVEDTPDDYSACGLSHSPILVSGGDCK